MFEDAGGSIKSPSLARQKLVLWSAFLIIICVSLLAFYSTQRLIVAGERVERTQAILIEVNRYLSEIKDVESRSRGYFVTGEGRYLNARTVSIANARRSAARLKAIQVDRNLKQRLDRLVALAEERIGYSDRLVTQRGSRAEALQNIRLGTNLMDRVRSDSEVIIASQTKAYRGQQRILERDAWLTSLALAAGVALCLGIIAWLFSLRGREVEQRRQLEEELRALNLELEDRVQERTAEVKRASDLLDAVVENLPDMIFIKDADNAFRYALINTAGETLFGRDRSEILGRTDQELLPKDEADLFLKDSMEASHVGQARTYPDRKMTTAAGVRIVESRKVPLANGGASHLILGIVRDVTSPRALEEQLRQLQRMDAVGRLTGGVAHDFNNLLAIIHGNSELLRARLDEEFDAAEMIDDVISAAARGAELVKRLLAFARMQNLDPESVDLNARLNNVIGLLQRALGENVNLRVKTAKEPWPAIIDPTQVDDALVNLAINARDAMPEGGTLTIETQNVSLDEDYAASHLEVVPGDYVMLAVSDTGCGMAPDVIARAFEPFFTTKQEGQGTGLGLSQVFGWVKQSRGHIKIYSEIGHGTTVKLYLPRAQAQSVDAMPRAETSPPEGDETILVVEDNPNVRKTVIRQLHDLGYQTIEAESGAAALRLVGEGIRFDLLLSDVIMPGGMTGYQLADELRDARPDLKVLFTSGYTELASGGDHPARRDALLSKPYRKQDLGRAVRAALDELRSSDPLR